MTTRGRLAGKFTLVTGGGSGIGQATARLFAEEGAAVVVADLDVAGADRVATAIRDHGGVAMAYRLDVTDESSWEALRNQLPNGGQLDVVVNSAGISFSKPIGDLALSDWQRVLAVNLTGVFLGTRFALRAMSGRKAGSVVNLASAAGVKAIAGAGAYCVSKAGVCMLTRVAALEGSQAGARIRVNAVLPGGVKTPLWRQMEFFAEAVRAAGSEDAAFDALGQAVPLKRYAEPAEIARAILYLVSDDSAYVTGTELVIDGGWTV